MLSETDSRSISESNTVVGSSQIVTRTTNYESLITVIISTIKNGSFAVQPQARTSNKHETATYTHQMSHHQDMIIIDHDHAL